MNPLDATQQTFRLGDVTIDPKTCCVIKDGNKHELEPRAMAVLGYLAAHNDRLVTIDELMSALWEGAVVTPNAVTRVIAQIRRALEDDARQPVYLKTVVRRGYQVISPVSLIADELPRTRSWIPILAAATGALCAAILGYLWLKPPQPVLVDPSIAVLPFANMTGDATLNYLGDGVSEEVINALAQEPALRVSSRTASFRFRDGALALPAIAKQLGVSYIVEGSVRLNGERLRITAQLIDVQSGFHMWSKTKEYDALELFQAQDAISNELRNSLAAQLNIGSQDTTAVASKARVPLGSAYDLYLRGRYTWHRRGTEPLQRAIEAFAEAVKVDPDFAEGWAALASAYLTYPNYSPKGYPTWALAKPAAEKALSLNDQLPEPHAVLATFNQVAFNWIAAEQHFLQALAIDPRSPTINYWYGQHLTKVGRMAAALTHIRRAIDLDPTYLPPHTDLVFAALSYGEYQWAQQHLDAIDELQFSSAANWHARLLTLILQSQFDQAKLMLQQPMPPQTTPSEAYFREIATRFIDTLESGDSAKALVETLETAPILHAVKLWMLNALQADETISLICTKRLERNHQVDIRSLWGPLDYFRATPEFMELVHTLNLVAYWNAFRWPDYCSKQDMHCANNLDSTSFLEAVDGISL